MTQHVARDRAAERLDEARLLGAWAHQAHVAHEHVPQLRQFVERQLAQRAAERRAARIVLHRPARARHLGVGAHAAELDHAEPAAVQAHALLRVEHGAARIQSHEQRQQQQQRRQQQQAEARAHEVERALEHRAPALLGALGDQHHGHAVEVLDAGIEAERLREVGHQAHRRGRVREQCERFGLGLPFAALERHVDHLGAVLLGQARQVGDRAQHGQPVDRAAHVLGARRHQTVHAETEVGVAADLVQQHARGLARAHDEHVAQVVPAAPQRAQDDARRESHQPQRGGGEHQEDHDRGAREFAARVERADRREARDHDHGLRDGEQFVGQSPGARRAVEPERAQHEQGDGGEHRAEPQVLLARRDAERGGEPEPMEAQLVGGQPGAGDERGVHEEHAGGVQLTAAGEHGGQSRRCATGGKTGDGVCSPPCAGRTRRAPERPRGPWHERRSERGGPRTRRAAL